MKRFIGYFTVFELILWSVSLLSIVISFCIFDGSDFLSLTASVIGVTAILFSSKGNPLGQLLMVVFSLIYGVISFNYSYYGEMITYMGMTMPMAVFAFAAWLRNPYNGNKTEVKVGEICKTEIIIMLIASIAVTVLFYCVLKAFNTANLLPSTISVTTSFIAVYLTFRRVPLFAVAYAANDMVLIILWGLASIENSRYIAVLVCFSAFLVNDLYCFICWTRMRKRQNM